MKKILINYLKEREFVRQFIIKLFDPDISKLFISRL